MVALSRKEEKMSYFHGHVVDANNNPLQFANVNCPQQCWYLCRCKWKLHTYLYRLGAECKNSFYRV